MFLMLLADCITSTTLKKASVLPMINEIKCPLHVRILCFSETTVNVLHLVVYSVFFLVPLAVESLRQIKYTAKCAFIKTL